MWLALAGEADSDGELAPWWGDCELRGAMTAGHPLSSQGLTKNLVFSSFIIYFGSSFIFGYNIGVLNQPGEVRAPSATPYYTPVTPLTPSSLAHPLHHPSYNIGVLNQPGKVRAPCPLSHPIVIPLIHPLPNPPSLHHMPPNRPLLRSYLILSYNAIVVFLHKSIALGKRR